MKFMENEIDSWVATFNKDDSIEEKLRKAAHIKPSPAQLAWMEKEFIAFVHYGPNTFNSVQWGNGIEEMSDYQPEKLDVAQWCRVCAQSGMKMMVFTAKHHDGFCQWNTKTTDFSSVNSPAGEDLMKSLYEGCKANDLQLGVYLSPWDMHQRKEGLWPTSEYNQYLLEQLRELLTNYGEINEVWFDGACSDYEIWKAVPTYTPEKWYELIGQLQPSAVVRLYDPHRLAFEEQWESIKSGTGQLTWSGKGIRWVGNEGGISRENEWSVQPVFDMEIAENATWKDLGEEKYYENAVGAIWYPLEVNTVVLNQWFWNEKTSSVRSLTDLVEVYYNSIGNNGTLLLNVSPDTKGVIREDQEKRLLQLKAYVGQTFHRNLAQNAVVIPSKEKEDNSASNVLDGNKMTFWTTGCDWSISSDSASLTFELESEKSFDQVMIQEYIREGQRVGGWMLEVWIEDQWAEVVQNKTIGYKTIRRFERVTTSKVRLTIQRSWDSPMISGFGLYLSADLPKEENSADKEIILTAVDIEESNLKKGLQYCCYDSGLQSAALLDSVFAVKLLRSGVADKVSEGYAEAKIGFSLSFDGYLHIPEDGEYTFQMENADGGQMFLGGSLLLNNDEPHEPSIVTRTMLLKEGYYPLKIFYTSFRHQGLLQLCWKRPGYEIEEISTNHFYRCRRTKEHA